MFKTTFRTAALALSVAALGVQAIASEALISDDTYTSSALRTRNLGATPLVTVGQREKGFLRFDLSALPSNLSSAQIAKATLQLWVSTATRTGTIKVMEVSSDWTEKTVTGAAEPTISTTEVGSFNIVARQAKAYVSVDLTVLVRDWVTATKPNRGVALVAVSGGAIASFDSKENAATSHEPKIEIVLAGPKGDAGTPGGKGDKGDKGDPGAPGDVVLPGGSLSAFSLTDTIPVGFVATDIPTADWALQSSAPAGIPGFNPARTAVLGDRIYFLSNDVPSVLVEYTTSTGGWRKVTVPGGINKTAAMAAGTDNLLYFLGGENSVGGETNATVGFNPLTGAITSGQPCPLGFREGYARLAGNSIYVGFLNQITGLNFYSYTPQSGTWTPLAKPPNGFTTQIVEFGPGLIYLPVGPAGYSYSIADNAWSPMRDSFSGGAAIGTETSLFRLPFSRYDAGSGLWVKESAPAVPGQGGAAIGSILYLYDNTSYPVIFAVDLGSLRRLYRKQ